MAGNDSTGRRCMEGVYYRRRGKNTKSPSNIVICNIRIFVLGKREG